MKNRYITFTAYGTRRMVMKPEARKKYIAEHGKDSDYEPIKIEFVGRIYQDDDNNFIVDTQYGYENHTVEKTEKFDSVWPGNKYRIMYQTLPKKGDYVVHNKSGRKFYIGDNVDESGIVYKMSMWENGKIVAYLRAEEYYKD